MRPRRAFVGVVAGVVAAGLLAGCGKKAEPTEGERPKDPRQGPPAVTTAEPTEYMAAVAVDPAAARDTYRGKVVEVGGTPTAVSLTSKGLVSITFEAEGLPPGGIVCRTADHKITGDVVPGRVVKLKGRVDPNGSGAELTDAEVVGLGPDTAVRMSADDLAKAAAADLPELLARCEGKAVVVTGTFDRLMKDGPSQQEFAQLRVSGPVRVMCIHANGYRYQLTEPGQARRFTLKDGDAVKWVGVVNKVFTEPGQFVLEECIPVP